MDAFVDYAYYTGVYHGASVSNSVFQRLARTASFYVNYQTFERAEKVIADGSDADLIGRIKDATCAAIEALARFSGDSGSEAVNRPIASETVGEHSVSYAQPGRAQQEAEMSESEVIAASIRPYLAMTGLMYQGVE